MKLGKRTRQHNTTGAVPVATLEAVAPPLELYSSNIRCISTTTGAVPVATLEALAPQLELYQ